MNEAGNTSRIHLKWGSVCDQISRRIFVCRGWEGGLAVSVAAAVVLVSIVSVIVVAIVIVVVNVVTAAGYNCFRCCHSFLLSFPLLWLLPKLGAD